MRSSPPDAQGAAVHAMTANAFTSASLDPALVLVSIDHRARMHQLLPATGGYGVSVLAGDHTLYLGRVGHLASRAGKPLLFHLGAFGQIAPEEAQTHSWGW